MQPRSGIAGAAASSAVLALVAAFTFTAASFLAGAPLLAADDDQRLRRDVVPTFESVRLVVDAGRRDYTGSAHVDLRARVPARSFRFHAEGLIFERVTLSGPGGPIEASHEIGERGLVTLTAAAPLRPGAYGLDIDFSGRFGTQGAGLYRVESGGLAYTFTQFEAADARKAFPCWDEPGFKIPYQMTLVVPETHLAISNTAVASETSSGGMKTVVFGRTPPLPSYLLAIATGPLETVPVSGMSIPSRIVTVRGQASLAAEAARLVPLILRALEEYFGGRYPFDKLDLLAVPDFWAGAMENAGAITFADSILLIDPKAVTFARRRDLVQTMAHEMAHMWFGDLVTMTWWDDLWLNESFASWMEKKIGDRIDPRLRLDLEEIASAQEAMSSDARLATRAMRQPVGALDNLDELADEIVYEKGQAVLAMFEHWIGPGTFRKGVLDYLDAHRWGGATASDLWSSLSRVAGSDFGAALSSFLDQAGVPLVTVDLLPAGQVRLKQRRFLNFGRASPGPALWRIPVTLKIFDGSGARTRKVLLTRASQTIALGGGRSPVWVYPNAGERGYYRWSVAPDLLLRIAADAATALDARERVGYLGNLSALLDAGAIRGDQFLRTLGRFADDPEPEVIFELLSGLYKARLAFVSEGEAPEIRDPFAAYVRHALGPALRRFGLTHVAGEDPAVSTLRAQMIATLADVGADGAVLQSSEAMARSYLADPTSVDPSLAGTVVRIAAQHGDRALFVELRERFEAATVPSERGLYLAALGGFRDPGLAEKALRYALKGPLRSPEVILLPLVIGGSPALLDRRLEWMMENYAAIRARIPESEAATLPDLAGGCSVPRLETARAFFSDPGHRPAGTEEELAKVAEEVADCARLRGREGPAVARYLRGSRAGE